MTLLFAAIATLFPDTPMVGRFGTLFGNFNRHTFGYLAFFYPLFLIYPVYALFRRSGIDAGRRTLLVAGLLLFLSLLMLQGNVFTGTLRGSLGAGIVHFLHRYIGGIGVWLFIFSLMTLSVVLLLEVYQRDVVEDLEKIKKSWIALLGRYRPSQNGEAERLIGRYLPKKERISATGEEIYSQPEDPATHTPRLQLPSDLESLLRPSDEKSVLKPYDVEDTAFGSTTDMMERIEEEVEALLEKNHSKNSDEEIVDESVDIKQRQSGATVVRELEENRELMERIEKGRVHKPKNFKLPKLDFLKSPPKKRHHVNEAEIDRKIADLLEKLRQFKIEGDVVRTYSGPVVTTFEFRPAAHIKVSKILTLQDDLAMALKARTIRIQAPIPGKDVVGIEIPNRESQTIFLKEILQSDLFRKATSPLTMALGKDIVGNPFITDLKQLPHLLIAGTTGSGKSVGINSMLVSLLYKNSPDELKLLMIDPKMLEFSIYNDIPHLLTPVITQPKQAILALANMVVEMERRYKLMSKTKTKNIENYNEKAKREGFEPFPYIVVIIDELADLMMTSGKDVEFYIARLAQMARASGIHLIVATQRPSVDVVTGLIKANLPSRISFKVGQKIDSKVILDSMGAESLLGRGDMLFTPPGSSGLIRLHAPFITEDEIETIVEFLKVQREVEYDPSFLSEPSPGSGSAIGVVAESGGEGDFDELYEEAKEIVLSEKKSSISYIQRKLQIGYNRAARIVEQLEMTGVVSAPNHKGQREILM